MPKVRFVPLFLIGFTLTVCALAPGATFAAAPRGPVAADRQA